MKTHYKKNSLEESLFLIKNANLILTKIKETVETTKNSIINFGNNNTESKENDNVAGESSQRRL